MSWTLDHVGPMTANMTDLAYMMEALTGMDYHSNLTTDIRGLRIGVPLHYFNEKVDTEIQKLYQDSLEQLEKMGAILIEVPFVFAYDALETTFTIAPAEAGYIHQDNIVKGMEFFGDDVRKTLERSKKFTSLEYITAMRKREYMTKKVNELFKDVDVIATPTLPAVANKIGEENVIINGEKKIYSMR